MTTDTTKAAMADKLVAASNNILTGSASMADSKACADASELLRANAAVVPEGWKLIAVNQGFGNLMYWLDRCDSKGHLENCSDLIEPWAAFQYRDVPAAAPSAPVLAEPAKGDGLKHFQHGGLQAAALLVATHGENSMAADLLIEMGLSQADCSMLDEFDREHLAKCQGQRGGVIKLKNLRGQS